MKKYLTIFIALFVFVFCGWYLADFVKNKQVAEKPIASVFYSCRGGKTIQAEYYKGVPISVKPNERPIPTGSVRLKFGDGVTMNLLQTISADGARYANTNESFIFWGKGNGVMILEKGGVSKNYFGCIEVMSEPKAANLSQIYTDPNGKFSLRLPEGYQPDESYKYTINPDTAMQGVKFTIPSVLAKGTNLSGESYISVENLPNMENCTANLFLSEPTKAVEMTENNITYSVASTTGAGAGNRYEETVYVFPGTNNPCTAIRYFIHYMVFENYPPGMVKEFDRTSLLREFDKIRNTCILQ